MVQVLFLVLYLRCHGQAVPVSERKRIYGAVRYNFVINLGHGRIGCIVLVQEEEDVPMYIFKLSS